jgi:hypothetical protein
MIEILVFFFKFFFCLDLLFSIVFVSSFFLAVQKIDNNKRDDRIS